MSGPGPGCCRGLIGYDGHMAEQLPAGATCAPAPNPTFSTSYVYNTTGRVRFKVQAAGLWLIKAVHMVPATDARADWASFWASLTFELQSTSATGN